MPIRVFLKYGHSFDDEAIRVMGLAFECARSALRVSSDDALSAKLAANIIELAQTGERDADKLCDFAINGLRLPPAA
jgi:hypothetical protein